MPAEVANRLHSASAPARPPMSPLVFSDVTNNLNGDLTGVGVALGVGAVPTQVD